MKCMLSLPIIYRWHIKKLFDLKIKFLWQFSIKEKLSIESINMNLIKALTSSHLVSNAFKGKIYNHVACLNCKIKIFCIISNDYNFKCSFQVKRHFLTDSYYCYEHWDNYILSDTMKHAGAGF